MCVRLAETIKSRSQLIWLTDGEIPISSFALAFCGAGAPQISQSSDSMASLAAEAMAALTRPFLKRLSSKRSSYSELSSFPGECGAPAPKGGGTGGGGRLERGGATGPRYCHYKPLHTATGCCYKPLHAALGLYTPLECARVTG